MSPTLEVDKISLVNLIINNIDEKKLLKTMAMPHQYILVMTGILGTID